MAVGNPDFIQIFLIFLFLSKTKTVILFIRRRYFTGYIIYIQYQFFGGEKDVNKKNKLTGHKCCYL